MKKILNVIIISSILCLLGACSKDISKEPIQIEIATEPIEQNSNDIQVTEMKEYTDLSVSEVIIHSLGFVEFFPQYWTPAPEISDTFKADKLLYNEHQFQLEFQYVNCEENALQMLDGWTLYGTKASELSNFTPYNEKLYTHKDEFVAEEVNPQWKNDYCKTKEFMLYNMKNNQPTDLVIVYAYYYPETGNLYNLVRVYGNDKNTAVTPPKILIEHKEDANVIIPKNLKVIWNKNYPIELAEFTLKYGDEEKTFQYRVGMTLSTWGTSELNTSDWFIGFEDTLFSPDYKFIVPYGEADLRYYMTEPGVIEAIPNELYPEQEMEEAYKFNYTPTTQVHLVNWKTPLLMPGLRINSNYIDYQIHQNFNLGHVYSTEDILYIYLPGLSEEMLSHIKIFAFSENQNIINLIRDGEGLATHNKATAQTTELLNIPENAYLLPIEKVEQKHEEGHSHEDAEEFVAIYKTTEDPNFTNENEKALAITYDDILVYWVHMPIFSAEIMEDNAGEYMTEEEFQQFLKEMEKQGIIVEELSP